MVDHLKEDIIY